MQEVLWFMPCGTSTPSGPSVPVPGDTLPGHGQQDPGTHKSALRSVHRACTRGCTCLGPHPVSMYNRCTGTWANTQVCMCQP